MYVKVEAVPGARKEQVTETGTHRYTIAVRAPAERNLANQRIKELLMVEYGVGKGSVRLLSGHRSRTKIYDVDLSTTA